MLKMSKIELVSASFDVKKREVILPDVAVQLIDFKHESLDEASIKYRLSFSVNSEDKDVSLAIKCTFESVYNFDEAGKTLLKDHIVVAHAVSYLREFVANLTMRSPLPTLIIDPANALTLLKDFQTTEA